MDGRGPRCGADEPRRLPAAGRLAVACAPQRRSAPNGLDRGLDIPFQYNLESQFFEFGRDAISPEERTTPERSRSEHLWAHPGLRPVAMPGATAGTPLLNYRWADTDAALRDQLELSDAGFAGCVEPGHAAVRYTNPTNGTDVLPTIRAEMHRIRRGTLDRPATRGGVICVPGLRRRRRRDNRRPGLDGRPG